MTQGNTKTETNDENNHNRARNQGLAVHLEQ